MRATDVSRLPYLQPCNMRMTAANDVRHHKSRGIVIFRLYLIQCSSTAARPCHVGQPPTGNGLDSYHCSRTYILFTCACLQLVAKLLIFPDTTKFFANYFLSFNLVYANSIKATPIFCNPLPPFRGCIVFRITQLLCDGANRPPKSLAFIQELFYIVFLLI